MPKISINENLKKLMFLGGLPLIRNMIVQPQMATICIPELNKHFLKISCELLYNYYLIAFTENLKYSPKKQHFIFLLRN